MAEEAGFKTILAAGLEDIKNQKIAEIRKKWADKNKLIKQKQDAKHLAAEQKLKDKLLKAEQNFEKAKQRAYSAGVQGLKGFFGQKTGIYKLMLGLEKALAINEVMVNSGKANAQITSNLGIANMKAVAASPLTAGMPFIGINSAIAATQIATNKTTALTEIAQLVSSGIQGFEDGLLPITRTDGKVFNAKKGGPTSTQIVSEPTLMENYLVGERRRPEMIIDDRTFAKLDPKIIRHIMQVHNGTVTGYETGKYNTSKTASPSFDNSDLDFENTEAETQLTIQISRLSDLLDLGITASAIIGFEQAEKIKELIDDISSSKQNGNLS